MAPESTRVGWPMSSRRHVSWSLPWRKTRRMSCKGLTRNPGAHGALVGDELKLEVRHAGDLEGLMAPESTRVGWHPNGGRAIESR